MVNDLTIHVRHSRGFSLVELIAVVAVMGILAAVAVPNFTPILESHRARNASLELFTTLMWARSEAVKRNASVTVARVDGDWNKGWDISAGGTSIGSHKAVSGVVITTDPADVASFQFTPHGRVDSTRPKFQIDVSASPTGNVRCISIDLTGRPESKKGAC